MATDRRRCAGWRRPPSRTSPTCCPIAGGGCAAARGLPVATAAPMLRDDIAASERLVDGRGMELLVLDQTRPDVGLPGGQGDRARAAALLGPVRPGPALRRPVPWAGWRRRPPCKYATPPPFHLNPTARNRRQQRNSGMYFGSQLTRPDPTTPTHDSSTEQRDSGTAGQRNDAWTPKEPDPTPPPGPNPRQRGVNGGGRGAPGQSPTRPPPPGPNPRQHGTAEQRDSGTTPDTPEGTRPDPTTPPTTAARNSGTAGQRNDADTPELTRPDPTTPTHDSSTEQRNSRTAERRRHPRRNPTRPHHPAPPPGPDPRRDGTAGRRRHPGGARPDPTTRPHHPAPPPGPDPRRDGAAGGGGRRGPPAPERLSKVLSAARPCGL